MIGLFIGGSGSIGSGLIKELVQKKKIKLIYNIDKTKLNFKHTKIKIIKKDLTKSFNLKKFKDEIDYAVILAFKINYNDTDAKKYKNINDKIIKNSLKICKKNNIKKILYASTNGVYGLTNKLANERTHIYPTNIYHKLKIDYEKKISKFCESKKINYCVMRFSGIYGKGIHSNIIQKFLKMKNENQIIQLNGDGKQKRDFLYIKDLSEAIFKLININKKKNGIFNISYGKSETLSKICKLMNIKFIIKNNVIKEQKLMLTSNRKIKNFLKWKPKYSFSKGFKDMVN